MTTPDSFSSNNGQPIAGANDLQSHIDALARAVEQNTQAVASSNNGNGTTTTVSQASQAQGARFTTGSQNAMAAGGNGATGNLLSNLMGGSGGGGSGSTATGGTSNGGSLLNFNITKTGSVLGGVANFASTLINSSGVIGANMMNDALTQNTYGYMVSNAGYTNSSGQAINGQQAQNALYGTIVNGRVQNGNRLANNSSDAALGGSMLTQLSNNPMFAQNAGTMTNAQSQAAFGGYGTSPYTTAAGVGLANPGLGEQGSANVAQALISPTASYNLQMLGVATQPIGIGGKSNSLASVESAMAQRLMGQKTSANGTLNQKQLTTNLNDPLMQYQVMQATGMTADEYQEWANSWEQQNQGALSSGKSLGQVQQGISQFTSGKITASQLQKQYGVSSSAYENSIQSQQSTNMAGENTVNQQFVAGLQSATTAVNGLTIIMTGLLASLGGAGAKVSGASAGAGTASASGILGAGMGSTITEGAALAGVAPTVFSSALGSAINSAVSSMHTGSSVSAAKGGTTSGSVSSAATGGSASANQKIAKGLMAKYGWSSSADWNALVNLWNQESGWNNKAKNPSSGAYGIAQALGHAESASLADNQKGDNYPNAYRSANPAPWGSSNSGEQISWGLSYIKGTYGSPSAAWAHETSAGWYASGTDSAAAGVAMVGERGPELVRLSGGQKIFNAAQTFNAVQGPYTSANRLMTQGGAAPATGGVHITIEKGAVTMGTNYQGVFTSQDAQSAAAQFEQALSKALGKSQTLQALAGGVTG
jgi:hypothetical protein